ncbi:MAG: helix-turn-helix transcriptional regulator [Syntrophales bacterium]|nr:helix-turn-helix transcriptional regulator [Syntrophales bacterium]
MQAHTKKHRTDTVELRFIGPVNKKARAIETLKSLGFEDMNNAVPWRDAYLEYSEEELSGKALAGMRYREGLTQVQLSEMTGIPQRHISEMENGKRPIGKETAKRLGKALNASYKVFL